MHTSSVIFGVKPLLSPIQVKPLLYAPPSTVDESRNTQSKRITVRQNRHRPARAHLVTTKNAWKQYTSVLVEPSTQKMSSNQFKQFSCFRYGVRKKIGLNRSMPAVFVDKSTFDLSKSGLDNIFLKQVRVLHAAVGPDEPHAASTTWPDGVLEKQGLDILDPRRGRDQRTLLEEFLTSELPSHPKLHRGQLNSGLRYLILPNKVPANSLGSKRTWRFMRDQLMKNKMSKELHI